MKYFYLLFSFIWTISFTNLNAQISVLFVDDSDDAFNNAELFNAAIDSIGYSTTYYNAVDSASSPTDLYMNEFDLVVWHTSGDGGDLQLWNGLDEDNASLKAYLDGGGKLWLVGLDFLFDRYGGAPVSFSEGEFTYDYLGLSSLDLQSYGDDGNAGVPIVVPDQDAIISGLPDLTWIFSTLWWVDGVSIVENATPIYRMGDESYTFADSITGVYYDNGTFQTLTYLFDIAQVADFELLKTAASPVLAHFNDIILGNKNIRASNIDVNIFPNPNNGIINLQLDLEHPSNTSVSLMDINGKIISELLAPKKLQSGVNDLQFEINNSLSNGYYLLKINIEEESLTKPVILQK